MFEIGDRVKVIKKKIVSGIGWADQMDKAIGEIGTIIEIWNKRLNVEAYLVKLDRGDELNHTMNYTFPVECLEAEVKSFNKGDIVTIGEKPDGYDNRVFWMEEMDEQVGLDGTVIKIDEKLNVALIDCEGENDDGEEFDQFWFPYEYLTIKSRAPQKRGTAEKWYLGMLTNLPFKMIRSENGIKILEDVDGELVSSEYLRVVDAPRDCKGFDWRKDEPR